MTGDLVIGLDSSTTATKAIAWDREGRAVAEGRAPIALSIPQPGWFEQEPGDWWGAAAKALKSVTRKVGARRIAAVAISNQRESFGQFTEQGEALRPGTLWLDERARPQMKSLSGKIGGERIHEISGKPVDVTPCLYRCAWLAENMPDIWRRTEKTAEVHGYLSFKLTGTWVTSTGSADPMGMLDLARLDWSDELISAVGLTRQQLPRLYRPGQQMGEVTAEAAKATGLREGTPLIAGGGDGQCAGTGTDVFGKGRAYVNIGTAVVSGSYGKSYRHDRTFRTLGAIAEEGYIYESCQRTGTFLVNWTVEQLFKTDPRKSNGIFAELEAEAADSPVGANGIALVPYWSGCMTPYWDSSARGVIAGLTSSHKRGDVYRAMLEGIALEQAMTTDGIAGKTEPIDHYVAIGGGATSDLWCQILADASGRDVRRLTTVEASSLGAGMAAAKGAGWYGSIPEAATVMAGRPVRIFNPEAKAHDRYRELLAIYRDLWPTLTKWNQRMADFAGAGHG